MLFRSNIEAIEISPTEGSEEIINMHLCNSKGKRINGYIKLIVGYMNFDEDGGVSDGIDDEIDYEYDEIMKEMKQFILDQCQLVKKEAELIEVLKTVLNDD